MQDLSEKDKEMLREFKNSAFWPHYREYVLTEAGKCLGQIRTSTGDDAYVKGKMMGLEKLTLDLFEDMSETGHIERANVENREYTKDLLTKELDK